MSLNYRKERYAGLIKINNVSKFQCENPRGVGKFRPEASEDFIKTNSIEGRYRVRIGLTQQRGSNCW
jgi:hypothetical protein